MCESCSGAHCKHFNEMVPVSTSSVYIFVEKKENGDFNTTLNKGYTVKPFLSSHSKIDKTKW